MTYYVKITFVDENGNEKTIHIESGKTVILLTKLYMKLLRLSSKKLKIKQIETNEPHLYTALEKEGFPITV